ncbi:MAG: outer membrane protein assembly factor BamD [Bacteroidaceae bacterium]|nr:outer membrane protein assembly factor BamD [Bacteroidaceae bacterium]
MKNLLILCTAGLLLLTSCNEYQSLMKSADYEYRYEAAKAYYAEGKYTKASVLLGDLVATLKGTAWGEECMYLLAMSEYKNKNYETAGDYFKKYYQRYPNGIYTESAFYQSGLALFNQTPDTRLDQTNTIKAMGELQAFMDAYPFSPLKAECQEKVMQLQDKLVEKEVLAAQLYYDLGTYAVNCFYGGTNYDACIVTARNALNDYPFAAQEKREKLSWLMLSSKYKLANESIESKRVQRFRDAVDEFYAFENDFPESKYMKNAREILRKAEKVVKNNGGFVED